MSHALLVESVADEMIVKMGENDHAEYYAIGTKITVTWMAGYQLYCCLPANRIAVNTPSACTAGGRTTGRSRHEEARDSAPATRAQK